MSDDYSTRPVAPLKAALGARGDDPESTAKVPDSARLLSEAALSELEELIERGRARDALPRLDDALRRHGDSARLRALRCQALLKLGRTQLAVSELEELRRRFPNDRRATALFEQVLGGKGDDDDTTTSMPVIAAPSLFGDDEVTAVVEPADVPALLERARRAQEPYVDELPTIHEIPTNPHGAVVEASPAGLPAASSQVATVDIAAASEPRLERQLAATADELDSTRPDPAPLSALSAPAEDPELSEPTFQLNPRAIEERMRQDESLGTFHEISSEVIKTAEEFAGQSRRSEVVQPSVGVDSFLAKVIGVTPAAPVRARPSAPSLAVAAKKGEAPVLAATSQAPRSSPPPRRAVPAPPSASPPPVPTTPSPSSPARMRPSLAEAQTAALQLSHVSEPSAKEVLLQSPQSHPALLPSPPRHQALSPWHSTPQYSVEGTGPKASSLLVDTGAAEDKPTWSISYQDAQAKMLEMEARRSTLSGNQGSASGGPGASPSPLTPTRLFWIQLVKRSFAVACLVYAVFILLWFPFVWESKLAKRMDAALDEGRASWHRGSAKDFRAASTAYDRVLQMQGSRSALVDSILGFYVESVLGREELSARRRSAVLEDLYLRSYLMANEQEGELELLREQLSEQPDELPLVQMARANLLRSESNSQQASALIAPLLEASWPSARLYELQARLEMERGDLPSASLAAQRAVSLSADSVLFSMVLALTYESAQPGDALKIYAEVLRRDAGHPSARLGRAHVVSLLGGQSEKELEALLAENAQLWPGQRARALEDLATIAAADGRVDVAEKYLQAALLENPSRGRLYASLVSLYLDQGQIVQAESMLRKSIELAPEDPMVRVRQAEWLARAGDLAGAIRLLDGLAPTHPPSALLRAVLALQMQDIETARASLLASKAVSGVGAEYELAEIVADLISSQSQTVQRMWTRIMRRLPQMRTSARLAIAWALTVSGFQSAEASAIFRDVLSRTPTEPSALAGECALSKGDEAIRRCGNALAQAGEHPAVALAAGLAYLQRERFADAWAALSKVVGSYSSLLSLRGAVWSGLMLYKVSEVRGLLEQWLQQRGPSGEHYFWAGRLALVEAQSDTARSLLGRALESSDALESWRPWYAEALVESGELAAATQTLRGLSSVSGVRGHSALVFALIAIREKGFVAARDHALDAVEKMRIDGGSSRLVSRAQVASAVALMGLGQPEQARASLERAIKADAGNIESYYQLGILERNARRFVAARAAFEQALTLFPEHRASRDALESLN
ncbi:MAG: tetratricopeptide repeat protein [Myxococcota bacterium]|jgi:predicted Zn-dependent protease|nr:tetratricopeptide repeat protein [Myxococcota bacterium]